MRIRTINQLLFLLRTAALLASCSSASSGPAATHEFPELEPTMSPEPTDTPEPTAIPEPTITPGPPTEESASMDIGPTTFVWKIDNASHSLKAPYGLGLNPAGNLYINDAGNHRVLKFDNQRMQHLLNWYTEAPTS